MTSIGFSAAERAVFAAAIGFFVVSCASDLPRGVSQTKEQAAPSEKFSREVRRASSAKKASLRIKRDLNFLADDDRRGRKAGSTGHLEAAHYVANRFASMGLEPGAEGRWFQQVGLRSVVRDLDAAHMSIVSKQTGDKMTLDHLDHYIIGRSNREKDFDVTAPMVFVGYGVTSNDGVYDDYDGIDARGKIVVAFMGAPKQFEKDVRSFYSGNDYKQKNAAAHGAIGFVGVYSRSLERVRPWPRAVRDPETAEDTWVGPDGLGDSAAPEIKATATVNAKGAEKLFEGAKFSFAALEDRIEEDRIENEGALNGFELPYEMTIRGSSKWRETKSPNVIGYIAGADPHLRSEVVVLTAHLDHVGEAGPNARGDRIYNGAIDNAMGIATLLEVARSFQRGEPPKRTLLFLAVTAEEKGLLGSDYFAHFPTVPIERIVANVNLDMPVTLFPFTDVIAFGGERSTLGDVIKSAAATMDIGSSPDPIPQQGIFMRSDHYPFVEKGVPGVFLFIGFENGGEEKFKTFMAKHYHQPSDDLKLPIDFSQAERFARLNYLIARTIADDPVRPQWREGDFFGEMFAPTQTAGSTRKAPTPQDRY